MAAPLHHATLPLLVLLLWVSSTDITLSQNIVETLPGFPGKLPFKLETGYIGVGDFENVQIFYYFFESERDPKKDPLLFFLTGGPGCSAIHTIFHEMGPIEIDNPNSNDSVAALRLKPYAWSKVSNLLVIDQPVGTGFSYGKTWESYITSDSQAAELTYQFLKKWLMVHPEYLKNSLYVGGDSYTGIYVPLIVQDIYNGNEILGHTQLNIKGYVQGNALTDKFADYNGRVKYAHRMGLLSDSLYESAKLNCNESYLIVDPNNLLCQNDVRRVYECIGQICLPDILADCCDPGLGSSLPTLRLTSSMTDALLSLPKLLGSWCQDHNQTYNYVWANNKEVQKALHVREGTIKEWVGCNESMSYEEFGTEDTETYAFNVKSTVATHQNLTYKPIRALIYSGDHDMVVPHTSTEQWINSLRLTVESAWRPWFVEGEIAGYTEKYSHLEYELTYATVKGGGHIPLEQRPEESFSMINRWLGAERL